MTEDLDRLAAGLRDVPAPDPQARARALHLAMESFERAQETADAQRRKREGRRWSAALAGVRAMLAPLASRPALAGTASVVVAGLGLVLLLPMPPAPVGGPVMTEAPRAAPAPMPATGPQPAKNGATVESDAIAAPMAKTAAAGAEMAAGAMAESGAAPAPAARARVAAEPAADSFAMAPDVLAEPMPAADTEAFAHAPAQGVQVTAEQPVSTFAIDVDTASYAIVRSSLLAGHLPPPEAVRIEEMVNYFPYAYPAPGPEDAPFRADLQVMPTPWNPGTQLVRIGLQGRLPALDDRPPLDLVVLVDTSGSMQEPAKLPLLKQAFRLMLAQLRPEDRVAIVTYAGSAGVVLPATAAGDRAAILAALDRLEAGGSTGGAAGLDLAYQVAETMHRQGAVGRVLLATDGDFNLGPSDPAELERLIAARRAGGIYLSVLGFGRGNLDDAVMQALAQAGNGTAAYIDTAQEARKVLVDQLSGALFPIADDVKIQVEWNPAAVAEWRLIGYETRALRREDFSNDRVDAGEIGAGHAVTALYEITPPGSPALRNAPLRYGAAPAMGAADELGLLRLRWKAPGAARSGLAETPIRPAFGAGDDDSRFAAAIAGFGQLLTGGPYLGDWGWDQAVALAEGAKGPDPFGYRAEAVTLMRLAQSLVPQ